MTNAKYVGTSSPSPLLSSSAFTECGVDGVDGFEDRDESFGRLCEAEPGVRMRAVPCPRFDPCGLPPTDSGTEGREGMLAYSTVRVRAFRRGKFGFLSEVSMRDRKSDSRRRNEGTERQSISRFSADPRSPLTPSQNEHVSSVRRF